MDRRVLLISALLATGAVYGADSAPETTAPVDVPDSVSGTPPTVTTLEEHNYIDGLGTFVYPDKNHDVVRRAYGASLIYGHLFNDYLSVELAPTFTDFRPGKGKGTNFYEYSATIDASYAFLGRLSHLFNPFVLGGVGGAHEEVLPLSSKKEAFIANAGGGFVTRPLVYGVALRGDVRYQYTFFDEFRGAGYHDIRVSLGVEIPLDLIKHTVAPAPEPITIVKETVRPWVDSDGDGVDDDHDKCPGTPRGLKVDSDGCVIPGQIIVLRGITFEFNKTRLQPNAEAVLDNLLPVFAGQAKIMVEIAGHTDSVGSAAYNKKLSQGRAESVRNYLIHKGAPPDQLRAIGYGKSQLLINPEKNDEDRELNRRVEFRVVDK